MNGYSIRRFFLPALLCLSAHSATAQTDPVQEWLRQAAVPLDALTDSADWASRLGSARVVGLGEATHGQRESFVFKRQLTMHLIREHGFRLVAYEANATSALALNAYVQGQTDDVQAAMDSFEMMIWMIEENRALLEDLRTWNQQADPQDRVEFIGIDVQGAFGAAARLKELLQAAQPELAQEAVAVAEALVEARQAAYGGETEGIEAASARAAALLAELARVQGQLALGSSREQAQEILRCARELARFPADISDPALRDRGMSESLLDALAARPAGTRAVLWGHNGHITKGPLRWMRTTDPGCGGFLRATLGEGYYALGFVFGSGSFQALHPDDEGKWWFRRYEHGPSPEGTVGAAFLAAGLPASIVDLRTAPDQGPIRDWLEASCGIRSWGGHGVPDDPDAAVAEGYGLAWTILAEDYDGLLFLESTQSATPIDPARIWNSSD